MIATFNDLIEYLREYHRALLPSPSLSDDIIPSDLPRPLAALYRELGGLVDLQSRDFEGHGAPFATQDVLLPLGRLKRIDSMIEFAWENQGNWSCRCALREEDPAVLCNWDDFTAGSTEYHPVCDSLSHFLTTLSLQEAVMSAPSLLEVEGKKAAQVLTPILRPIWLNGKYVFDEARHNFYEIPGRDILVMEFSGVWVASHSNVPLTYLRADAHFQHINSAA